MTSLHIWTENFAECLLRTAECCRVLRSLECRVLIASARPVMAEEVWCHFQCFQHGQHNFTTRAVTAAVVVRSGWKFIFVCISRGSYCLWKMHGNKQEAEVAKSAYQITLKNRQTLKKKHHINGKKAKCELHNSGKPSHWVHAQMKETNPAWRQAQTKCRLTEARAYVHFRRLNIYFYLSNENIGTYKHSFST